MCSNYLAPSAAHTGFTLVLPPLQLLACCVHVATVGQPGRCHRQLAHKSHAIAALLATWCALDIFLLGCLAAMLELGDLTATIGGALCGEFEFLVPDGDECFRSEGRIEPGFFWLLGATLMWALTNMLALCGCHDRRERQTQGESRGAWDQQGDNVRRLSFTSEQLAREWAESGSNRG